MNLTHSPLKLLITASLSLVPMANAFADQQDNIAIEKGKQLYQSYNCAVCHGEKGKGDGENAEAYDPYPTNFHDTKGYHHGYKVEDIIHSIKYGIKDNPNSIMPSFSHLTDQELKEISAYLLSLQEK
jgi:mono/diheme cytochrome c family protein